MTKILNNITFFLNKHVNWILLLIVIFSMVTWVTPHKPWYEMENTIFHLMLSFLFVVSLTNRVSGSILFFTLIFNIALGVFGFFDIFANWFFFKEFKNNFNSIIAKDANVIIICAYILIFCVNFSIIIKNIVVSHTNTIKSNLNRIFICLSSGAIIITTLIFHFFVINQFYVHLQTNDANERILALSAPNEVQFNAICNFKGYICAWHQKPEISSIPQEDRELFIKTIFPNKNNIHATFMTGGGDEFDKQEMIAVEKKNNTWVIDDKRLKNNFLYAQTIFLSLMTLAHSFWFYFTLFLFFFHRKKSANK